MKNNLEADCEEYREAFLLWLRVNYRNASKIFPAKVSSIYLLFILNEFLLI